MTIFGLNSPELFVIILITLIILGTKRIEKGLNLFSRLLKFLLNNPSGFDEIDKEKEEIKGIEETMDKEDKIIKIEETTNPKEKEEIKGIEETKDKEDKIIKIEETINVKEKEEIKEIEETKDKEDKLKKRTKKGLLDNNEKKSIKTKNNKKIVKDKTVIKTKKTNVQDNNLEK